MEKIIKLKGYNKVIVFSEDELYSMKLEVGDRVIVKIEKINGIENIPLEEALDELDK